MNTNANFDKLQASFKAGRLIPFVGAGFSMIDAAMPSWKGLIKDIAMSYQLENDDVLNDLPDHLEQAEYLQKRWKEDFRCKESVENQVCEAIKRHPEVVVQINLKPHRLLLENFDRIYTTNFDSYFERLADSLSPKITIQNVPARNNEHNLQEQHPYLTRNKSSNIAVCLGKSKACDFSEKACRLIKYHGDCDDKGSLVFTETSYFKRLLDADIKDILFAGDAVFYDFLFLGYGFGDISLKYTLQQLERVVETLATTGQQGKRETTFYILRTDQKPRNRYQDLAYNLCSLDMGTKVPPAFTKGQCRLASFYLTDNGTRHGVVQEQNQFVFSSFQAVWDCAEAEFDKNDNKYCECKKTDCPKVHLTSNTSKPDVTDAAKQFRAHVLNEGFTNFLEKLVSP